MVEPKPWFVIAGGGTGGHLYPGLAVAEEIRRRYPDFEVTIFGTPRPIDRQLADARGYSLVPQEVQPFPGNLLAWPGFLSKWFSSVREARSQFERRRPAVVLGLGGYAAGPPIVAASKLKIPTALFNPDAIPGRANRKLASRVNKVFVQWRVTEHEFSGAREVICTGCPIRSAFSQAQRSEGERALKLDPDKKTLLITGASQGAASINAVALELIDLWTVATEWQIVHLTGKSDFSQCRARYQQAGIDARVLDFTEHMPLCMAAADLVLSRAGASTLAEITAMGLPSVLMPYPFDRHQHQLANAQVLVEDRAAELVIDKNDPRDNAVRLREVLRDLMRADERRRRMGLASGALGRLDSAEAIANELLGMARL